MDISLDAYRDTDYLDTDPIDPEVEAFENEPKTDDVKIAYMGNGCVTNRGEEELFRLGLFPPNLESLSEAEQAIVLNRFIEGNVLAIGPSIDLLTYGEFFLTHSEFLEDKPRLVGIDPIFRHIKPGYSYERFVDRAIADGFIFDTNRHPIRPDAYARFVSFLEYAKCTSVLPMTLECFSNFNKYKNGSFRQILCNQGVTNYTRYPNIDDMFATIFGDRILRLMHPKGEIRLAPFMGTIIENRSVGSSPEINDKYLLSFSEIIPVDKSPKPDKLRSTKIVNGKRYGVGFKNANDSASETSEDGKYYDTLSRLERQGYKLYVVETAADRRFYDEQILKNELTVNRRTSLLIVTGKNAKVPFSYGNKVFQLFTRKSVDGSSEFLKNQFPEEMKCYGLKLVSPELPKQSNL